MGTSPASCLDPSFRPHSPCSNPRSWSTILCRMDPHPLNCPLVWKYRHHPHPLDPPLPYHPETLQGWVSVSLASSHPSPNQLGTTDIPSLKYLPTSPPFVDDSLPVVCFDAPAVALSPTLVKIAPLTCVLGAWSLPLVMPNTTAPFHVVVWAPLPIVTTHLETNTSRILGSEVVPQMYNGGNVTE